MPSFRSVRTRRASRLPIWSRTLPHVDLARSIGTRIGEGLREHGELGEEPMRRTIDAVRSHLRIVRGHYVRLFAIATSALRRASNGEAFTKRVQGLLGVPLQILSGDEEAAASYRGAITAFGPLHNEELGVVDVGGGSTEYATGNGATPDRTVSCEIGAVRLTEMLPLLPATMAWLIWHNRAGACNRAQGRCPRRRFSEGGTRGVRRRFGHDGGRAASRQAHKNRCQYELSRSDLQRALVRLCALPLKERKTMAGMKPQRADILPAGIIVLETVLDLIGEERATVTSADLLLGHLLQQVDRAGRAGSGPGWSPHGRSGHPPTH